MPGPWQAPAAGQRPRHSYGQPNGQPNRQLPRRPEPPLGWAKSDNSRRKKQQPAAVLTERLHLTSAPSTTRPRQDRAAPARVCRPQTRSGISHGDPAGLYLHVSMLHPGAGAKAGHGLHKLSSQLKATWHKLSSPLGSSWHSRKPLALACLFLLLLPPLLGAWHASRGTFSSASWQASIVMHTPGKGLIEELWRLGLLFPRSPPAAPPPLDPLETITVMVAMIGRDVAGELPYVLRNVQRLVALVQKAYVVLVENDSTDNTQGVFLQWLNDTRLPGELVSLPPDGGRRRKDLILLAEARNAYLDLLGTKKYQDVQYLIAVDTDMCFPWNISRIQSTLNHLLPVSGDEWHALFANGACGWFAPSADGQKNVEVAYETPGSLPTYCDILAFRDHRGWPHSMFEVRISPDYNCTEDAVKNWGCRILSGEPVVPVHSAFGGWGMYRTDVLLGHEPGKNSTAPPCRYASTGFTCEHAAMSECIKARGGRQFIANRILLNWEGCEGNVTDECWRC